MRLKEYKKSFDMAPMADYEFAEAALLLINCDELRDAAQHFLNYRHDFIACLEKHGVEIG